MNTEDQSKAQGIISYLLEQPESSHFSHPFDFRSLGLPDYPLIIKSPIDLATIQVKLQKGIYSSLNDLLCDVILIWDNTRLYHLPDSNIIQQLESMESAMTRYCSLHSISLEAACKKSKVKEHPDWIPMNEKEELNQLLRTVDSKKLGLLVDVIETECPIAVRKNGEVLQIRIDALDRVTFNRIFDMAKSN